MHGQRRETTVSYERYWPNTGKWYNITIYSPKKGYFVAINEDITERKKAEEALQKSEAKFRGLFENIQDGVSLRQLIYDDNGEIIDRVIVEANPAALKALGVSTIEDVRGMRDGEILKPELLAKLLEETKTAMTTGKPHIRELHFDANNRDYLSITVPLGKDHVLASTVDITERKRIEDELKRSNEELQQFAYLASHDLQEPLRMVISYLSLLDRKYKGDFDSQAKEYIDHAIEGELECGS